MNLKLKELREEANLTQKELADTVGNVQRNISNWENGISQPDYDTLIRLANYFNVTIDELLGRDVLPDLPPTSALERMITKAVRKLSDEQKAALLEFINTIV